MPPFPEPFVPFFSCLPQQLWYFYFPLLSLSFQESFQQLVSPVSQGPLLCRGGAESCITGEGSRFHQFSLIQLYCLSPLDSAPSGSNPINAVSTLQVCNGYVLQYLWFRVCFSLSRPGTSLDKLCHDLTIFMGLVVKKTE